ncbi:aminoglycoside phosphotransferase family protein [Actinoallomurus sp. CA-142502]|uniref:aminoglycoside phosphotransferase family protein n=1 Tax=Actinoallomurus sp. CA-142502 TaxID=3239885 RepID=UPI003D901ADE
MVGRASTHQIETRGDRVTKRFVSAGRGEAEREWRALRLLAEHSPGLAPRPIDADLAARPPYVVMSRLAGTPLRGMTTTRRHTAAMARAIGALHEAVPRSVVAGLPPASWNPAAAVAKARALRESRPDLGADPTVAGAYAAGAKWLDGLDTGRLLGIDTPVLGLADGNLANYLWDGERVRLVDFEDSGRSDRAFELAEVAEHISARTPGTFDATALLGEFDLPGAVARRVREFRRVFAYSWMLMLGPGGPARDRNPPGTLERQAGRLLDLLG